MRHLPFKIYIAAQSDLYVFEGPLKKDQEI